MNTKVQIASSGVSLSPAMHTTITADIGKLDWAAHTLGGLASCRVSVERPAGPGLGHLFNIRLHAVVGERHVVVNHPAHEDFYVALRHVFGTAQNEVLALKDKRADRHARHAPELVEITTVRDE